ncbi:hypothetical protein V8G54_010193 [Vigna mungo]|uniref:Uncharacterized protein n=1 Tax=Vigna mungo TaxID=3915 RepID=A0AAQ3NY38_VIGMU
MENERTRKFCFWCVNGEEEDMWVTLGLICKRFAQLELREVEEDDLQQRQHLGCGQIFVFYRSVCGFLVIDGEEDDLVVVDGATAATRLNLASGLLAGLIVVAGGGKQRVAIRDLQQRHMVDDYVVEIRRYCCWHDDDLTGARMKMQGITLGGGVRTKAESRWLVISMVVLLRCRAWVNRGLCDLDFGFYAKVMEVQQKGEDALVLAHDALERMAVGEDDGDDARWCVG